MTLIQAVIFILLAAAAGYVFGIVDSRFTATLRKRNEKPAPPPPAAPVERNRPGEHTVLEVMVDKSMKWHLEVDGTRHDDPASMTAEKRQRLINTIVQIRPWLDGKPAPATSAPAPEASVPVPVSPAQAMPAATPMAVPPASPAISAPEAPIPPVPQFASQPVPAPDSLKVSAMRGFSSILTSDVKRTVEKKPDSIVAMIDAVLQKNLAESPLKDKGIRLEENPAGGVFVWVGLQRYSSIDEVTDPDVRAAIKAAISEWDKNR